MVGSRLGVVCCMRGRVRADVRLALPILGLLKNTGQPARGALLHQLCTSGWICVCGLGTGRGSGHWQKERRSRPEAP